MDSDNILSILASLGAGQSPGADAPDMQQLGVAPANVLQGLSDQSALPVTGPAIPQAAAALPDYSVAPAEAPRKRRSVLETIGQLADVFAKVGGAEALYQPTLDARQDRTLALSDHDRKVQADDIALATGKFDLGDKNNLRIGQTARGLKAIQAAGGDINQAWPVLAQRMQLDPATIDLVGQALATDPNALDGLIGATTDPKYDQSKYGGSVVYGKDASGNLVAFQPSLGNDGARNILPEGITPVDPLKFVDTGGAQIGVGTRSGNPVRIMPKTIAPDTKANIGSRERIAREGNATRITIAGMPARGKDDGKGSNPQAGLKIISDIQEGFNNLHQLNALPGEGGTIGNAFGAIGRTRLGQAVGATTGLSAAAQERELLAKNLANLQSDLINTLPGNATRTRFEQEIQKKRLPDPATMNYSTANRAIAQIRDAYLVALRSQSKAATPVKSSKTSGWAVVEVK